MGSDNNKIIQEINIIHIIRYNLRRERLCAYWGNLLGLLPEFVGYKSQVNAEQFNLV